MIPRQGVETLFTPVSLNVNASAKVIPRQGVETSAHLNAHLYSSAKVIPRQGVETNTSAGWKHQLILSKGDSPTGGRNEYIVPIDMRLWLSKGDSPTGGRNTSAGTRRSERPAQHR